MKRTFIISLIIVIPLMILLSKLNIPMPAVFGISFICIFFLIITPQLYFMYFSNNVENIERFMKRNLNQPLIALYYAMANKNDELIDKTMEKILKKYRKANHQAIFKTIFALYYGDVQEMKKFLHEIKPIQYQYYYKAIVSINEGYIKEAEEYIEKTKIEWMKSALKAELYLKSGMLDEAENFSQKAVSQAKGLQKYILAKNYEQEFSVK
ncbi:hypothetical protein [Lederbergia citrea]|uniref:hypothetical protein n=1 Tax=Lederbergia citrea TaxID=2833581 RepID=UPI001BC92A16|nr:hypothetical protein [Lederbergia citrea]MBS4178299.1 hypothetical protein [Lederbergia citrea]